MSLTLARVLPNLSNGLGRTGFLFGAGTSVEAGYPMMPALTRAVFDRLTPDERASLDEVLSASNISYDAAKGLPNIEVLADHIIAHAIDTGLTRFAQLEGAIKRLITDVIIAVKAPMLDYHIRFLQLLKQRAFGRAACVYIFTTNYDVLFELAAAETGVVIETGFIGAVERFFDHQRLKISCGEMLVPSKFKEHPVLTIRLIKLHGSISWIARQGTIFERHPAAIHENEKRIMILPRKRKVMDTLQHPHDLLFGVMSRALGTDCKYIVSCGFSFGDEHINQTLLIPALMANKVQLHALCGEETSGMAALKLAPSFRANFAVGGIANGTPNEDATDCWKFSRFVDLFT